MENPLALDLRHILDHTRPLWEELRGERIFITGGTGFFGRWLLESFLWANRELGLRASAVVLTRNPRAFTEKAADLALAPAIDLCAGDVRDFHFPPGRFAYVIHAATEASAELNSTNPLLMLDTIVEGTRRTLDFAVQCGARGFLLTSSGAVYGSQPVDVPHIGEDCPRAPDTMAPDSAYGEGKRMAELLCAIYHRQHGLQTKIARCFAFSGPYLPMDRQFAAGVFLSDALAGKPILIRGNANTVRSYLYAADLAIWLWKILIDGLACRPYNAGSERAVTIQQLAGTIARATGSTVGIAIAPSSPESPATIYVPATKRAQSELGLEEWIGLADGISRTVDWRRRTP